MPPPDRVPHAEAGAPPGEETLAVPTADGARGGDDTARADVEPEPAPFRAIGLETAGVEPIVPSRGGVPRLLLIIVGALVILVAGAVVAGTQFGTPPPTPVPTATIVPYDARGRIVPVRQSRVATLAGGVVRSIGIAPGARLDARDEIARVEGATGTVEVIVAPIAGTVLAVPVQEGDGLVPGALVAVVGDLSELRVESTDVDEYLIGRLRVGQSVEVVIDALDGRSLGGRIDAITMLPQTTTGGDLHYPVLIRPDRHEPELRPGMTARLRFPDRAR